MRKLNLPILEISTTKIHVCMYDYELKAIDAAMQIQGISSRSAFITNSTMKAAKRIINKERVKKLLLFGEMNEVYKS